MTLVMTRLRPKRIGRIWAIFHRLAETRCPGGGRRPQVDLRGVSCQVSVGFALAAEAAPPPHRPSRSLVGLGSRRWQRGERIRQCGTTVGINGQALRASRGGSFRPPVRQLRRRRGENLNPADVKAAAPMPRPTGARQCRSSDNNCKVAQRFADPVDGENSPREIFSSSTKKSIGVVI